MDMSDEAIATLVQKGDQQVFGIIVERYEARLLRYGTRFLSRREDAQDIVQEVFIRVYQNIQSFDTSQRFSPWIYRIAHNAFVNALKKNSRSPFISVDFDTFVPHLAYDDPSPREREQQEMRVMIEKGLAELTPKYREILILYYLEEMSYQEIADIVQIPIGTVGVRVRRAKESLKNIYLRLDIKDYGT